MDSKCVNKDYLSIMYRIRTSAQTFTSADQTENYDSDGLIWLTSLWGTDYSNYYTSRWETLETSEFLRRLGPSPCMIENDGKQNQKFNYK